MIQVQSFKDGQPPVDKDGEIDFDTADVGTILKSHGHRSNHERKEAKM